MVSALVRRARQSAGLSQASLARQLGTTQSALARLEADASNPRIGTLERVLRACGRTLDIQAKPIAANIDETLVARQLRMSPAERLASFERSYADVRKLAPGVRRARRELA